MLYKITDSFYNSIIAEGKYRKKYIPGTMVCAVENTIGLMLFTTVELAINFASMYDYFRILEVEPMDKVIKPVLISHFTKEHRIDSFYQFVNNFYIDHSYDVEVYTDKPIYGTVCCRAVKVVIDITNDYY